MINSFIMILIVIKKILIEFDEEYNYNSFFLLFFQNDRQMYLWVQENLREQVQFNCCIVIKIEWVYSMEEKKNYNVYFIIFLE